MKLKPEFEPEFAVTSQRWSWPIRSIGRLMIVVGISGVVLSLVVREVRNLKGQPPKRGVLRIGRLKHAGEWNIAPQVGPGPVPALPEPKGPPRDRSPTPRGSFPSLPVPALPEPKGPPRDRFVI